MRGCRWFPMGKKQKKRIATGGEQSELENPVFSESLAGLDLPEGEAAASPAPASRSAKSSPGKKQGHRVDLKRETKGRGGKTVIVISGFPNEVGQTQLKALLKRIQASCGTGGTVQGKTLEIQGDHRDTLCSLLQDEGYRPVLAGG